MSQETYFNNLNKTLQNYKRAIPCLLVDIDILDENIATLKTNIHSKASPRIVVKSLPSFELLQYVSKALNTNRFMVFHQPFLSDLASKFDQKADILIGKPMPIKTANYFYKTLPQNENFNAFEQIQWLIDTKERLNEYLELAKKLDKKLRINIEIDVGLHRGGFTHTKTLKEALQIIQNNQKHLEFSGFMGYDAHIVKLPKIICSQAKALKLSNNFYQECKDLVAQKFPDLWHENLTFNGAGSPTVHLHNNEASPLNDIAFGSCLVKPTTFDIPSLKAYKPASFIATPILKKFEHTTLPALEKVKRLLSIFKRSNQQSFFIYGGFWKANYHFPKPIKQNNLFGASTNQTMLNAPKNTTLNVDDFVFLRPHQSEFVFLQFGEILPLKKGKIQTAWHILKNH